MCGTNTLKESIMIKTKSIYKPKEDEDGLRILITRFYPRGVRKDHFDQWLRELAPTKELLKDYKEGKVSQTQFKTRFLKQMNSDDASMQTIQTLSKLAKKSSVTLLCYEPDEEFCHRHLLADMIKGKM